MAEEKKNACQSIDEAVSDLGKAVDELGDLMEKGADALGDIGSKIDEALGKLADFELPGLEGLKICECKGYDPEYLDTDDEGNPIYPNDETSCTNAGGFWECREASSLNLREEVEKLAKLAAEAPDKVAKELGKLTDNFGDLVDDLGDKLGELSPALGNLSSGLLSGNVESCVCVGGDPFASTKEECEASGGTWQCTTREGGLIGGITGAIGDGIEALTGGVTGAISDLGNISFDNICEKLPDIQVDECEVEDMETGEKKVSKKVSTFAPMSLVPNEAPKFSIPASFPKPAAYPKTSCVCSDPFVEDSTKEGCLAAGGTWQCTIQDYEGGPVYKKNYKLDEFGKEFEWSPVKLTDEQEAMRINIQKGIVPGNQWDHPDAITPQQVASNKKLNENLTGITTGLFFSKPK